MSKYSKSQEYRLKEHLEKIQGVEIIKYYGNREKNRGDFLVSVNGDAGKRVRIEHKSTENQKSITLHKKWLLKTIGASMRLQDREGNAIPLVTFSLKYCPQIYTWSWYRFEKVGTEPAYYDLIMSGTTKSLSLAELDLEESWHHVGLDMGDGVVTYVHELEYWFEAINQ